MAEAGRIMSAVVVVLVALCVLSAVVGILVVRHVVLSADSRGAEGSEVGTVRVRAQLRTGPEQSMIALARELQLPGAAGEVPYGGFYLDLGSPSELTVRTHSTLGRGLVAPIAVETAPGRSLVTYSIVSLPRDEELHARVLDFELTLIAALRRIDQACVVRLAGTTLRDLERATLAPSTAAEARSPRR